MFERFTRETRLLVMGAVDEASSLQHRRAGTGHILVAMIADTGGPTSSVLGPVVPSIDAARAALREVSGPSDAGFDDLDAEALRRLGIDLEEIRNSAETAFGSGALDRTGKKRPVRRLTDAARQATFLAFKEAKQLRHRRLDTRHLLLALLDQPGPTAAQLVLDRLGADRDALRYDLVAALRS